MRVCLFRFRYALQYMLCNTRWVENKNYNRDMLICFETSFGNSDRHTDGAPIIQHDAVQARAVPRIILPPR